MINANRDFYVIILRSKLQTLNSEGLGMKEEKIGFVSNYFSKISVAAVEISDGTLSVGDTLHFLGHTTNCESRVNSTQKY